MALILPPLCFLYYYLFVVACLPHLLPIDRQELLPVRFDIRVSGRPHDDSGHNVVKAPLLIRGLPAQVDTPPDVVRHVGQAGCIDKKRVNYHGYKSVIIDSWGQIK